MHERIDILFMRSNRRRNMNKLRHIAMQVPDLEKASKFYESVFGMERVGDAESPIGNAISLSDGVMNLTLLNFPDGKGGMINGQEWAGLHHLGFVVDDKEAVAKKVEESGGEYFMELPSYPGVDAESKYKDVNGLVFDLSEHDWKL
ncbi:MAG TPA: VOC family protein [Dehalococcoidia bacterium]|nr:VOC family protein [Dehalococcoidia bacterium]